MKKGYDNVFNTFYLDTKTEVFWQEKENVGIVFIQNIGLLISV